MIAIGGVVDLLIPPSIILVVYAIATEQNIAKLFMAAMIPGLLAVAFYSVVILIVTRMTPGIRSRRRSWLAIPACRPTPSWRC
jgi:C4-dicarboxylate transporter DctM subunit